MKVALVFLAIVACALAVETYPSKYDNINIDEILNSPRLLNSYVKCLLETGPCTPEGKTLKEHLPDALENGCSKCSEKQKVNSDKVIRHLVNEKPDVWAKLSGKYDPTGEFKRKFQTEAQKRGINV